MKIFIWRFLILAYIASIGVLLYKYTFNTIATLVAITIFIIIYGYFTATKNIDE